MGTAKVKPESVRDPHDEWAVVSHGVPRRRQNTKKCSLFRVFEIPQNLTNGAGPALTKGPWRARAGRRPSRPTGDKSKVFRDGTELL
jgi:hypothetical protein